MSRKEGPLFNLKVVVQQTGLKPDTLRAWERRYGLPSPERSSGGHRLYSQRDIDTVKWLMVRQREGLSISRAVELWKQTEAEGRNPLEAPFSVATATAPALAARPAGGALFQMREDWIAACLAYDERNSEQILAQAFALYPPETVCLELLQKAMAAIGDGWYRGDVTVQQEHFCSALAIRHLELLVMAAAAPTRPGRILAACPPEEEHVFGLLLLTLLLRRRGWEVVYLGANVPVERLETTVAATNPQLVILAAQRLHTAATLMDVAQSLQHLGVPTAYGGMIANLVPALRDRIPGHFLGEDLDQATQTVETLMMAPRRLPVVEAVSEGYRQAQVHFREREGLIEADMIRASRSMAIASQYLAIANRHLAQNIDAALALGDMSYLGTDLEWIKGLLSNYDLPVAGLRGYLVAYLQAAREHLDERGEPIVTWLDRVIRENGFSGTSNERDGSWT
jgi:DNA-binding transcriptional MerR regulator/methylmalonyl-CoA mutase cobalamin-binding subunit